MHSKHFNPCKNCFWMANDAEGSEVYDVAPFRMGQRNLYDRKAANDEDSQGQVRVERGTTGCRCSSCFRHHDVLCLMERKENKKRRD